MGTPDIGPRRVLLRCSRCRREWGQGIPVIVIVCLDCFADQVAEQQPTTPRGPDRRKRRRLGPWTIRSDRRRHDRRRNNNT